jgi:hypothetical protein
MKTAEFNGCELVLKGAIGSMAKIVCSRLRYRRLKTLPMTKTKVTRLVGILLTLWSAVSIALVLTVIVTLRPLPNQRDEHEKREEIVPHRQIALTVESDSTVLGRGMCGARTDRRFSITCSHRSLACVLPLTY